MISSASLAAEDPLDANSRRNRSHSSHSHWERDLHFLSIFEKQVSIWSLTLSNRSHFSLPHWKQDPFFASNLRNSSTFLTQIENRSTFFSQIEKQVSFSLSFWESADITGIVPFPSLPFRQTLRQHIFEQLFCSSSYNIQIQYFEIPWKFKTSAGSLATLTISSQQCSPLRSCWRCLRMGLFKRVATCDLQV